MGYRRGFKTHANSVASETRVELQLGPLDRFDPFVLAEYLAVPVIRLADLAKEAPEAARHFLREDEGAFSAVTVFRGSHRVVVYNDAHVPGRQHSDLAHELAHALLRHEAAPAFGDGGCRDWDSDIEDEATFLGAALLVSEEIALDVVRRGRPIREAAHEYGVTPKLMQWRINATGARKRVERGRNYRRSRGSQAA
jgi:hypothetical protein